MTTRAQIAALLTDAAIPINRSTVKGSEGPPSTLAPGAAWSRVASWTRDGASGAWQQNWEVWLVLPVDDRAADRWADDNLGEVAAALEPVAMYLDQITKVRMPTGEGSAALINGLVINGHSE